MEEEGKRACCLTDQRQHAVCTEAAVSNLVNRLDWKGFIGNIERLYWQHPPQPCFLFCHLQSYCIPGKWTWGRKATTLHLPLHYTHPAAANSPTSDKSCKDNEGARSPCGPADKGVFGPARASFCILASSSGAWGSWSPRRDVMARVAKDGALCACPAVDVN